MPSNLMSSGVVVVEGGAVEQQSSKLRFALFLVVFAKIPMLNIVLTCVCM